MTVLCTFQIYYDDQISRAVYCNYYLKERKVHKHSILNLLKKKTTKYKILVNVQYIPVIPHPPHHRQSDFSSMLPQHDQCQHPGCPLCP